MGESDAQEENDTLRTNVDVLNSLSFEHHVSNEVQRLSEQFDNFYRKTKKGAVKTKNEIENEVRRKSLTVLKRTGRRLSEEGRPLNGTNQ